MRQGESTSGVRGSFAPKKARVINRSFFLQLCD
jgi:hypothetical protein